MYEELVKRLNAYSAEHEYHGGITAEAADAIEELLKAAKAMHTWIFLKPCKYETFDYSEDCVCCGIDFDGTDCPYIKPWGRRKYKRDHEPPKEEET